MIKGYIKKLDGEGISAVEYFEIKIKLLMKNNWSFDDAFDLTLLDAYSIAQGNINYDIDNLYLELKKGLRQ